MEIKQVMLLGHSDSYTGDKQMQVTIAYNHFGEGLIQRMPRYVTYPIKVKISSTIITAPFSNPFWILKIMRPHLI
jgi:hypothetical protein